jgi:hypothetical protein
MHIPVWRFLILIITVVLVTASGFHKSGAEPDEISVEQLRTHVYFLASDYLGGRVMGTRGYRVAAEYAASQMSAAGLRFFPSRKTNEHGFLHPVPVPSRGTDDGDADGECCNVVGYIAGTDSRLAGEYVVVSAHLDHIPPIGGEICNGADDNASGCAAVLELARLLAKTPPERPVLFVLFTGEDYVADPRLGSRYFLDHWPVDRGGVFVNVNIDMIGREDSTWPKPGAITIMNSESVCPDLREVCAGANEHGSQLPLHYDVSQGGSSDSRTFAEAGIPSLGLFTGAHPDLHRPTDEVDRLSFPRIHQVTGLALDIIRELGTGSTELCQCPQADTR